MTRELLLARRLLEAIADADAPLWSVEEAGAELAAVRARTSVEDRRMLRVESFEGMVADDLSPLAWLLLLEGREQSDIEIPDEILNALYLEVQDDIIRFRLVRGALGQPHIRRRYEDALKERPEPQNVEDLPESWPRSRILFLETVASRTADGSLVDVAPALQELVLYLLQDGSAAAMALAAGAVAPAGAWRNPARQLALGVVRALDSDFSEYGRAFRRFFL